MRLDSDGCEKDVVSPGRSAGNGLIEGSRVVVDRSRVAVDDDAREVLEDDDDAVGETDDAAFFFVTYTVGIQNVIPRSIVLPLRTPTQSVNISASLSVSTGSCQAYHFSWSVPSAIASINPPLLSGK